MVQPFWKTIGQFIIKVKYIFTFYPANPLINIYPSELKIHIKKLYLSIYSNFIPPKLETTKKLQDERIKKKKKNIVRLYNEMITRTTTPVTILNNLKCTLLDE